MPRLTVCLTALLLLGIALSAHAEDAELAKLFHKRAVTGALVLVNRDGSRQFVHNEARAKQPLLPASTFKIPNTLIALEEGAATGQTKFIWDGTTREIAAWNHDQTLAEAFKNSCVWCYQQLAQRIGTPRYQHWLTRLDYGNARPGPELTSFWLSGDLRISAWQQVAFLQKLQQRQLPFSASSYDTLRTIMLVEQQPGYRLYAKTGWAGMGQANAQQTGWYVGYLESEAGVWYFALNIDITAPQQAAFRQQIVMEALKTKGILH